MTSTIHDLGYQRYSGERLSMRSAWSALFVQGVRTMLALGRPARSKALPVFVLIFSCVPAILTVFLSSQAGLPIRHATYFTGVSILYVLFAAAQAPELFSRDQANRVLPLVFTRDLSRWQYFSARLASVVVTLVVLAMVPQFILWLGAIGLADDTMAVLRERLPILGPILAVTTLAGCLLGSVSSAVSAFTPRRHFATAAIVGLFIVLGAATAALGASDVVPMKTAELFNPVRVLDMSNRLLFDEPTRRITREAANPLATYLAVIVAWCAASTLAVLWRSQRVDA